MVTDDATDKAYALALKGTFDGIEQLSLEEINSKFRRINKQFFPDITQPKNLMLQEVHSDIVFDALDPHFPNANPKESLERLKRIINDYLSGNFYPSYFSLSGYYTGGARGYTWNMRIKGRKLAVYSGNENITKSLKRIINSLKITQASEADLENLQNLLSEQIGKLTLADSEIQEHLEEHPA